jgi:hypothetical protein
MSEALSLTLIDADVGQAVAGYAILFDGETINLNEVGHNLSIRANCDPCKVGSVLWSIDGVAFFTDNTFPFAIRGTTQLPDCKYTPWSPGVGTFVITATPYDGSNATGAAGTPITVTLTFTETSTAPGGTEGWTSFLETGDTKKIYVSSSGSDSNTGLSEVQAVATLAKAKTLLRGDGNPDWILLKRGDTWTENFAAWSQSGKSVEEPVLISYYGASGDPPQINSTSGFTCHGTKALSFIAITGIDFTILAKDPADGSFDPAVAQKHWVPVRVAAPVDGFLFEGCWLSYGAMEVIAEVKNLRIRRNVFKVNYVQNQDLTKSAGYKAHNIYISNRGEPFVVEENIFDYGGWHPTLTAAGRLILAHNLYCDVGCGPALVRRNVFCRGSLNGCMTRGGGVQENNLFVECAAVGVIGSRPSSMIDNVCLSGADISPTLPRGFGYEARRCPTVLLAGNVIANKASGVGGGSSFTMEYRSTEGWHVGDPPLPLLPNPQITIRNNIIYNWHGSIRIKIFDGRLTMTDNVFNDSSEGAPVNMDVTLGSGGAVLEITGNKWFSNASSSQRMKLNGSAISFATWQQRTGDTSQFVQQTYSDPTRTVERYNDEVLAGAADLDDFMDAAKLMWRENWDEDYTAPVVNNWIRAGFVPT